MNLRTLSIGLSAAMLLGICGFWFFVFFFLSEGDFLMLDFLMLSFIFSPFIISSVFPQIVSLVISVYSKHPFSHIIAATILVLHVLFFVVATASEVWLYLPLSGILLMPAVLPLWLTACIVERRYRKKNQKVRTEP